MAPIPIISTPTPQPNGGRVLATLPPRQSQHVALALRNPNLDVYKQQLLKYQRIVGGVFNTAQLIHAEFTNPTSWTRGVIEAVQHVYRKYGRYKSSVKDLQPNWRHTAVQNAALKAITAATPYSTPFQSKQYGHYRVTYQDTMAYGGRTYTKRPYGSRSSSYGRQSNRVLGKRGYKKRKFRTQSRRGNYRTGGYSGMEMKFLDYEVNALATGVTWTRNAPSTPVGANSISSVPGGSDESSRNGRTYRIHSLAGHIQMVIPATEVNTGPEPDLKYRLVCVLDTQTNAAALDPTTVMTTPVSGGPFGFPELANVTRFKILWDSGPQILKPDNEIVAANTYANGRAKAVHNVHILRNMKVVTDGSTLGTVAQITDNSIQLLVVCSNANALLSYNFRLRFTDA